MRAQPARLAHLALLLAASALVGSCSRSLPTAPSTARTSSAPSAGVRRFHDRASLRDYGTQVVVTLAPGADPAQFAVQYGFSVLEWDPDERVAALQSLDGSSAAELAAMLSGEPGFATAETNRRVEPAESRQKSFAFDDGLETLPNAVAQPALESLHAAQAQSVSIGDEVKVAVLDTGVDPDHPLLRNRIAASWDFIEGRAGATDTADQRDSNGDGVVDGAWGHGSHVAGIVALSAPGARLMIGRVLDSDGQGDVLTVAAGIRWAVRNGARVINLSLGTLSQSEAIANALEEAEHAGVVVVTSAGNWGAETPQEFPASSNEVTLAVAACDAWGVPAPWTSYGSFVGVTAPGVAVRSAYPGGTYRLWSGTSMAAPFVAGAAALVIADHPDWTPAQVRERIRSTTGPLAQLSAAQVGKLGTGMLDLGGAVAADGEALDPTGDFLPGR